MTKLKILEKTTDASVNAALDTISIDKQAIVFVNTKRSAESLAEKIANKLPEINDNISDKILKVLSNPTKQCKRLALVLKKGIAFHHSGLISAQRSLIENNFRDHKIRVIVATPTLCVSSDTMIWHGMSETKVSLVNHSSELFVLSKNRLHSMKAQKVQKKMNTQKLIEIKTVSEHSIKITPNHKLLVKHNGKKKLIYASECEKTDKIATIGKIHIDPKKVYLDDFNKKYPVPSNHQLTESDFYFIGAMLGDGYSGAETKDEKLLLKGNPCIVGIDHEIFEQIELFCRENKLRFKYRKMPSACTGLIISKVNWLREFLCTCGVEKGENKYIAKKLKLAPEKHISALLRGLFDTDGYIAQEKNIGISTISKKLIKDIQRLLLRFGIVVRIRKRPGKILKITEKSFQTKDSYELTISNNECIYRFYSHIGFGLTRKQLSLQKTINNINSNIKYVKCIECGYIVYYDLFYGRSKAHQKWGDQKLQIIKLLGNNGSLTSNQIKSFLRFLPYKKGRRLNHHFEIIIRKRLPVQNTEYLWSLNSIGKWIYREIIEKGNDFRQFFNLHNCPICNSPLNFSKKKTWRSEDFDGDIYWDMIKSIKEVDIEPYVYDVVLPNRPLNDHLFVANGIVVHNSAGLDLPAFRVIIRDLKRYGLWGMEYIPVLEYYQMAGRAGRPSYDSYGEAIILADSDKQKEELLEKYIRGEPEDITSKLASEPIMRTYILSLIASGFVNDIKSLEEFFSKTFYAKQYGNIKKLNSIIRKMIDQLKEWEFIKDNKSEEKSDFVSALKLSFNEKLETSSLGKRVSELYLDPYTAHYIVESLRIIQKKEKLNDLTYLQMFCSCLELRPLLRVKTAEFDSMSDFINENSEYFLEILEQFDDEYDDFLKSVKTARFFMEWLDEKDEEYLLEKYDVRPGEINAKKDIADWLLYSSSEIARLLKIHSLIKELNKIRFRLQYGVKEELIPLLQLRNIGRVRARILFNNNLKDIADIKRIDLSSLSHLIGKSVALDVKKQVGQDLSEEKIKVKENKRKGQIGLNDYK